MNRNSTAPSTRCWRASNPRVRTPDASAWLPPLESAVEHAPHLDVDLESGILTVTCPDSSRVIVNRQTPNREIWVAARSGGFHFTWREGEWRDTRSGEE